MVTPTASAMLERLAEETDCVSGAGGGVGRVIVDVGNGVKMGGEEDGGRVMLGRIGTVVVRLLRSSWVDDR